MKCSLIRVIQLLVLAFLLIGVSGCDLTQSHAQATDPLEVIQGKWKVLDSVAKYEVQVISDKVVVKGYSSFSGKKLQISNVSWDGAVLKFTSYMPSTNFRVHHVNRVVDNDTMKSTTTGDSTRVAIWKKEH